MFATIPTQRRPGDVSVPLASGAEERWSPVLFHTSANVDEERLRALLEAARWAPSSYGEEPWRFLVARRGDPWRHAVDDALSEGNAWARDAAVLIVGMAKRTLSRNGQENRMAAHDLGIALGGMLAEATAQGLATHPMGGFRSEAVREAFGVPEDFGIHWVLAVGHHDPSRDDPPLARREQRPRRRRSLSDTAFGERFGNPAPI